MYNEGMGKSWPIYEDQNSIREELSKKKKAVAWFVSHCRTSSKREHYANQLKKYIDVDVYGRCGPLKCGNSRRRNSCLSTLSKSYKFYLAFENSICRDYVTEKFYNALSNYVVPLVNGAVDYKQFAPPGSYIHVRDFKSPKHLADYLKYLDSNQTAYEQYFEWRKYYIPKPHRSWCKLCEMLNNSSLPRQSYRDVYKWWKKGGTCGGNRKPMRTSRPEMSFTWNKRL